MIFAYIWFCGFIISLPIRSLTCDYGDFIGIYVRSLFWPYYIFKK